MRLITALFGFIAIPACLAAEPTDLSEARQVYEDVRSALARGDLMKREREFTYREPYQDSSRTLYASSSGVVRLYMRQAGSDDSAVTWNHYYDQEGRLRFVFIAGGAVNGTQIEHRIWFASDGKRIREQRKLLEGPGYTFPDPWPDERLVRDPKQQFASSHPCTEVSGK